MNKTLYMLFIACAGIFTSCADDAFYVSTVDMKHNFWQRGESTSYEIEITDTTVCYDIALHLRNNESYPWTNIYVISSIEDTTGTLERDTTMCNLFDITGRPTGHGLSNVKENTIVLWEDYMFPHGGEYEVKVSHGMRNVELPGIASLTLRIVKNDTIR
ncbi:MAG: gliding motility lipoprotein GldH [Flavobacteriales bacterium]|nr:gliding motility lipoprotein GldH [Flavobacteriales bacterium]